MGNLDYFFEIVDGRKTVRKYSDYVPTGQEIERIIESARLAPSATNSQNWMFIAIYNQEIKDKMALEVEKMYEKTLSSLTDSELKDTVERYKGHSTFFKNAPVIIVIVQTPHTSFMEGVLEAAGFESSELKLMRPDSQLLSMGGAIENMSLAAHALGLGSCWMAAPLIAHKELCKILELKEGEKIVSILTIGKPYEINDKRSSKKPLSEVMKVVY